MDREQAHKLIDQLFDKQTVEHKIIGEVVESTIQTGVPVETPARTLPEGQRVVRTKSSGDRVYLLDDNKKSRQWITNPDVLAKLGFEQGDVKEVDDSLLLKYSMGPALYRVE